MTEYTERELVFDEDEKISEEARFLVVVAYDIVDNRNRTQLAKCLLSYGTRIQRSVFECVLNRKQYDKLLLLIPNFLGDEDVLKVYKLRGDTTIKTWGNDQKYQYENCIII